MGSKILSLTERVEALGYELFETSHGRQVVIDGSELAFIHGDDRDDRDDKLEDWLADMEAAPAEHRLRVAAERVCGAFDEKLMRSLPIEASRAIDDLATALDIAKDKLMSERGGAS